MFLTIISVTASFVLKGIASHAFRKIIGGNNNRKSEHSIDLDLAR
jgi:hypothetical protein